MPKCHQKTSPFGGITFCSSHFWANLVYIYASKCFQFINHKPFSQTFALWGLTSVFLRFRKLEQSSGEEKIGECPLQVVKRGEIQSSQKVGPKLMLNLRYTHSIHLWYIYLRLLWKINQRYCSWTKSCTSWYGKYHMNYEVLYIPGGAGFLPSTVGIPFVDMFGLDCLQNPSKTPDL